MKATEKAQITFVCCVEAGSLEAQTVRMVQSLRRFGGQFANAPIIAVTPRFGPPLSRKTHKVFDQQQVMYLRLRHSSNQKYTWHSMINKPKAILAVDELVRSEAIAWLDSDLLIAGDMNALALADEDDFVACTSDRYGATTGPDDPEDCYWQAVCKSLNIDIEALPWVRTEIEKIQVRLYFNSGLFVYRHDTGFAIRYLENCIRLLDSRIASKSSGLFFTDQIALGLTAFQLGFRCRSLGCSYNYPVSSGHFLRCEADRNDLTTRNVKVLHYHNSMWPPFWPEFLMSLKSNQLEVADWLEPLGPMKIESAIPTRLMGRLLRQARDKIGLIYAEGCSHF